VYYLVCGGTMLDKIKAIFLILFILFILKQENIDADI
jgi:hypothetical protein